MPEQKRARPATPPSGHPDDNLATVSSPKYTSEGMEQERAERIRSLTTEDDAPGEVLTTAELLDNVGWAGVQAWMKDRDHHPDHMKWEQIERSRARARRKIERELNAEERGGQGGATWFPNTVGATVEALRAGTISSPVPTVGQMSDGRCLFYAGKVNGVHGESGSGKSWTALYVAAQELGAGGRVAYIDLEDDEASIVDRLMKLGVPDDVIASGFYYLSPDESFTDDAREVLLRELEELAVDLVIIDSTGEALALDGARPNDDDDVARWFVRLPQAVARRGPAVVLLDHTTKATDKELWPIGSQRKRAAISGAQYLQKLVAPFDKDTPGGALLTCAKDRHGNYRVGLRVAAVEVHPDSDIETVDIELIRVEQQQQPVSVQLDEAKSAVAAYLNDHPNATATKIKDAVAARKETTQAAINALEAEGYVQVDKRRQAHRHTLLRPYVPELASEPSEDPPAPEGAVGDEGVARPRKELESSLQGRWS